MNAVKTVQWIQKARLLDLQTVDLPIGKLWILQLVLKENQECKVLFPYLPNIFCSLLIHLGCQQSRF